MSNISFQGAHDFVLNDPQFAQFTDAGSGIKDLLKASLPESFYDSSARDPSPHCHPGTRQNFIDKITSWGSGGPRHPERILWMQGPAGVGKSALAQTCAELLAQQDKLAAAFFFSRPNIRDDPACLFTSISYQIATKSELYNKILDRGIRNDPTLVKKAIRRQFHELLVNPLQELGEGGEMMKGRVVIIDGLDECAGTEAQREIIDIITASILNETTPFRWAFFSRPEVHIVAAFASSHLLPLSLRLELPVSREIDHEILRYLTDELEKIQVEYGLPSSWLSKSVIGTLVNLSAGLFIYAATIIRFLRERNSLGPVDQLKAVVLLATYVAVNGSGHPLAELDLFYILIMQRIPPKILPILKKILLLNVFAPQSYMYKRTYLVINILGISEQQFRTACGPLHSVLSIESQNLEFCHASFSDFLQDQERSKEFCIYSDCLDGLRRDLLERLNDVHANSTASLKGPVTIDITWAGPRAHDHLIYRDTVGTFFRLCQSSHPLDASMASELEKFQFQMIPHLCHLAFNSDELTPELLMRNVPVKFRKKVVRKCYNPLCYFDKPPSSPPSSGAHSPYILGHGKTRVVCWKEGDGKWTVFRRYPSVWGCLGSISEWLSNMKA